MALLFGDAGTATALEFSDSETPMLFELGADGSGANSLIIPAGFRHPATEATALRTVREGGNVRSDEDLFMDGPAIFSFALSRVPDLVQSVLAYAGCKLEDIDHVIFHQANRFMLLHLAKRIKIPADKFVVAMENFGNTSSARFSPRWPSPRRHCVNGFKLHQRGCFWPASAWAFHGRRPC